MEPPPPPPTAPAPAEPPSTADAPPPPQPQATSSASHPLSSLAPSTSEIPPPPSSSASAPSSPIPTQPPSTPPPPQSQQHTHQQPLQPQQRPPLSQNRPNSPYPHFIQAVPSPPPSSSSSDLPRGGLAIGVPAHHHPRPPQPPATLSPFGPSMPFSRTFSPLPRNSVGGPEQSTISTTQAAMAPASPNYPVRQPIQGIHSIGMIGSLSTGSQIRPSGIPGQHPQRFSQPSLRATSPPANQSLGSQQKFLGHGLPRAPSMTSPSSSSPAPQSSQSFQQPLASAQGKQMHAASLPSSSSYKTQMMSQASQQRPHHLQQHHQSLAMASQYQQTPSSQQQQKQQQKPQLQQQQLQHQASPQEHHSQQHLALRNQQSTPQQQGARVTQKSNFPAAVQSGVVQSGVSTPLVIADATEPGNHIVSKRSIRELVTQIDPSEKLDPEVEDVLVEIADDFIESITTFACSLAKHRKSTTLEAKDVLLHVERNWNITLPGFGGDEIKCYKKQPTNDIHKERLAVIKKSMVVGASDAGSTKNSPVGQAAVNRKAHAAKPPATAGQAERSS